MGFKKVSDNNYYNEEVIEKVNKIGDKYYLDFTNGSRVEITETEYNAIITAPSSSKAQSIENGVDYFEIIFDSNGGTAVPKQLAVANGKIYSPTMPTKAGKTFGGWFKGETMFNFNTNPATENLTLVAHWED